MITGHYFELLSALARWTPPQGVNFVVHACPVDGMLAVSMRARCGHTHHIGFTCFTPLADAIGSLDAVANMPCDSIEPAPASAMVSRLRAAGDAFEASLMAKGGES